ncbi:hypothetical protein AYO47_05540 [Planctomyces sp. SCGC AG-212-M04]|nr:hypothetical protein AYO47_05540 [Planctomyces sp. SCGC AG-212-M04]
MLKLAIALTAALGMAQVAYAQATAGDTGQPGTSTNRNQGGTAQRGSGTQGTAANNQTGQSGSARAGAGQNNNAGTRPGQTGQTVGGTGRGGTANQGGRQMAGANLDGHAADCLILKNEEEIELLQSSQSKIQNDELKQAAQKMIQDHQQAISKLQKFAMHRSEGGGRQASAGSSSQGAATATTQAGAGTTGGAATTNPSSNTTGASGTSVASNDAARGQTREARRVGTDEQADGVAGSDSLSNALFQVAQREKEECLKVAKEDLGKHEGAKFDKAFAGMQSGMHGGMLAKLRALQGQGSSEFSQLLQDLEKTTAEHKDHIDKLMPTLAKEAESGQKRR